MPFDNDRATRREVKKSEQKALFSRIDDAAFYCVSARMLRNAGIVGMLTSLMVIYFGFKTIGISCCVASLCLTALGYILRWVGTAQIIDILKAHHAKKKSAIEATPH